MGALAGVKEHDGDAARHDFNYTNKHKKGLIDALE